MLSSLFMEFAPIVIAAVIGYFAKKKNLLGPATPTPAPSPSDPAVPTPVAPSLPDALQGILALLLKAFAAKQAKEAHAEMQELLAHVEMPKA